MTDSPSPAFINPSGDLQSITLLLGRLDSKVDLMLLSTQSMDARLRAVESVVVPRTEIDGMGRRLDAIEQNQATNRGIMKALVAVWGAATAILGLPQLAHLFK